MTGSKRTLSVEARASRTIIGRVARGESLRGAFRRIADEHGLRTAWVSAIGAFEHIDFTEYNQVERRYEGAHRFERCELLSMQGNLSLREGEPFWHLHATVSLREDGRDVTYGGHVGDAVVFALEFRPGRQGSGAGLAEECAVEVYDRCVTEKEYLAAYRLMAYFSRPWASK